MMTSYYGLMREPDETPVRFITRNGSFSAFKSEYDFIPECFIEIDNDTYLDSSCDLYFTHPGGDERFLFLQLNQNEDRCMKAKMFSISSNSRKILFSYLEEKIKEKSSKEDSELFLSILNLEYSNDADKLNRLFKFLKEL